MTRFWLCFVPLFVAVDAIGLLPLFLALTEGVKDRDLRRIILQSILTAAGVAIGFLVLGQAVLSLLGITVHDFMIAGGILLFGIAFSDILSSEKPQRAVDPESLGAVPLGVPRGRRQAWRPPPGASARMVRGAPAPLREPERARGPCRAATG